MNNTEGGLDGPLKVLEKQVNDSGFPFQLGVKTLADSTQNWRAGLTEHPWHDSLTDEDRFIDLVSGTGNRLSTWSSSASAREKHRGCSFEREHRPNTATA
jgi:hypothetical protein